MVRWIAIFVMKAFGFEDDVFAALKARHVCRSVQEMAQDPEFHARLASIQQTLDMLPNTPRPILEAMYYIRTPETIELHVRRGLTPTDQISRYEFVKSRLEMVHSYMHEMKDLLD